MPSASALKELVMREVAEMLGSHVGTVSFGVSFFRIDLSNNDGQFFVSTGADVCFGAGALVDFRDSKSAEGMVDLVGACVRDVQVDQDCRSGAIEFDNGVRVRAWWPDRINDNLFIVRDHEGRWWFPVG
jgi:hypothetical protein